MSVSRMHGLVGLCALLLSAAVGCSPSSTPAFDGSKAYGLLKKQVDIGPRYPGIPGHDACRDLIVSQLKPLADEVSVQEFSQVVGGNELTLQNIIATFSPGAKKRILLAAHWDTRPIADMEVEPEKRSRPILGANDGASGVAVLLELARMFHDRKPDVGITMVFFDGEDYATKKPSESTMYLGSKYFAKHLDPAEVKSISYGVLLDMVGDTKLGLYQESFSQRAAPEVTKRVWDTAKMLGYEKNFVPECKYSISDDHLPLIDAGVKCIDVIDFDYGPWHTLDDTADKCSAGSLKIVGDVIARVVYEEKGR